MRPFPARARRASRASAFVALLALVALPTRASAGSAALGARGVLREVPLDAADADAGAATAPLPRRALPDAPVAVAVEAGAARGRDEASSPGGAAAEASDPTSDDDAAEFSSADPAASTRTSTRSDLAASALPSPSASSIAGLPSTAVAFDVRLNVEIPDTTKIYSDSEKPGLNAEFAEGKTLVWCKSFLVRDASESVAADSPDAVPGVGDVPVAARHIVAVEPMPGSPNVHHMHLHVCDADSPAFQRHKEMFDDANEAPFGADDAKTSVARGERPRQCAPPSWAPGSGCHGTAWTFLPGQDGVLFPQGLGMRIAPPGKDSEDAGEEALDADSRFDLRRFVLEVHYDQAQEMRGAIDHSGLRFWAVPDPKAIEKGRVGVLSVADPFARLPSRLPPGEPRVTYATHCPPGCTSTLAGPMHVFASMTHAHLRARRVVTTLGTPDTATGAVAPGGWRSVVSKDDGDGAFSHDMQRFEAADFTIQPGDSLRTTCGYDTSGDSEAIAFGPATSQEMCMQVFLYWPKQPTFLCGYYDEEKYWCGDAEGFASREGQEAHGEWCVVGEGEEGGGGGGQTCDEKNAELEREREARKVVMRRRLSA